MITGTRTPEARARRHTSTPSILGNPRLRCQTALPSVDRQTRSPVPNSAQTCRPSLTGVGVAMLWSWWALPFPSPTLRSQTAAPWIRSKEITCNPVSAVCAVRYTRLPTAMGEEAPLPETGTVHFTCCSRDHSMGKPESGLIPRPSTVQPSSVGVRTCVPTVVMKARTRYEETAGVAEDAVQVIVALLPVRDVPTLVGAVGTFCDVDPPSVIDQPRATRIARAVAGCPVEYLAAPALKVTLSVTPTGARPLRTHCKVVLSAVLKT